MNRSKTRRGLVKTSGTAIVLGFAGCLGSSDETAIDGTLSVTNAEQFNSPGCGCWGAYASYLRNYLDVTLTETEPDDVSSVKQRHGIPTELRSCHTLVLDEYVIEGHVPVEAIAKLLEEEPPIKGVALPGMPSGSPGMAGTKSESFTVRAVGGGRTGDVYVEL